MSRRTICCFCNFECHHLLIWVYPSNLHSVRWTHFVDNMVWHRPGCWFFLDALASLRPKLDSPYVRNSTNLDCMIIMSLTHKYKKTRFSLGPLLTTSSSSQESGPMLLFISVKGTWSRVKLVQACIVDFTGKIYTWWSSTFTSIMELDLTQMIDCIFIIHYIYLFLIVWWRP